MIPYFQFTTIPLGPINIQVWGLFVALGILTAIMLGRQESKKRRLDVEIFTDLATTAVVGGLIGARLLYALAYAPTLSLADPLSILRVWEGGMSMFGGLLGGALASYFFVRRHSIDAVKYVDVCAYVLPLGYAISRIGCFLIHDHPGTLSSSFLAVQYPGGARLDHGLLLMITGFAIFALFYYLNSRNRTMATGKPGHSFVILFMLYYGVIRFFLDFYRASDIASADARYFSLTPGQIVALAFIIIGSAALMRARPRLHAILP